MKSKFIFKVIGFATILFFNNVFAYTDEEIRKAIKQSGSVETFLSYIANTTAKQWPRLLDKDTEGISVSAQGNTIQFFIRYINSEKSDILKNPELVREVIETSTRSICTLPTSKILINENGAKYRYVAMSKSREFAFEYTVDKSKCSQIKPK